MPKPTERDPSRRTPQRARAQKTRQRLIDAGRTAFATNGVDRTNLAEHILEPAGVSVGSFYHQFGDKAELARAVIADGVDARFSAFTETMAADYPTPEAMVRATFERLFDSLDHDRDSWLVQFAEQHRNDSLATNEALRGRERLDQHVAEALGRWSSADADTRRRTARSLVNFATGVASVYLQQPEELRPNARPGMLDSTIEFAMAGLSPILGD